MDVTRFGLQAMFVTWDQKTEKRERVGTVIFDKKNYDKVIQYRWNKHKSGNNFYADSGTGGYKRMHSLIIGKKAWASC